MLSTSTAERTLTELDHARLTSLLRREGAAAPESIDQLVDACTVVASRAVAPDVVTMYSRVVLRDLHSGARSRLAVCWPPDAEPAAGFVSALSPAGSALLGLRVGDVAQWTTPGGERRAAAIETIVFQPEASGDYAL